MVDWDELRDVGTTGRYRRTIRLPQKPPILTDFTPAQLLWARHLINQISKLITDEYEQWAIRVWLEVVLLERTRDDIAREQAVTSRKIQWDYMAGEQLLRHHMKWGGQVVPARLRAMLASRKRPEW